MRFTALVPSRIAAGIALALSLAAPAQAQPSFNALAETVAGIEARLGARVGVALVDTGSDRNWTHRADERFLMNSTVKVPVCAAILARRDAGLLRLSQTLPVTRDDLLSYAPVAETRVGGSMTLSELCLAAIDMSDNTAANLLIGALGGPAEVTQFFRDIGDPVSRLDRVEPDLNSAGPGDPRDSTTPVAMADTLWAILIEDALSPGSRAQMAEWMRPGGVTGALLRASAPAGWDILDKSGAGERNRNLVAVITPPGRAPWIAVLMLADLEADVATRNAALQELGAAVVAVIGT
ncbi:class A beta-lactamase [Pseudooceanicola sp. LIPI14-2-Ac024]|uniref:class A beta-lactamase n=1 Tax=Pseudooceanicola sp. LIPI14-2-Ac024 TaxID=3344875 RepID=UPI0035CFF2AC